MQFLGKDCSSEHVMSCEILQSDLFNWNLHCLHENAGLLRLCKHQVPSLKLFRIFESRRQLSCAVHFKYGLIYREVLHTPVFDVCMLMEMGTTNSLVDFFLQIFKDSVPEVVHLCPYDVSLCLEVALVYR